MDEKVKELEISSMPEEIVEADEVQADNEDSRLNIHMLWAGTIVIIVIAATMIYFSKSAKDVLLTGINGIKAACRSNVNVQNVWNQTIGDIDETKKLVVLTSEVTVELDGKATKRIFADYIPWGEAKVSLKLKGNKVQFYVPLEKISADSFLYDSKANLLTIKAPKVLMDKDMIFIQNDPTKIEIRKESSRLPFGPDVEQLFLDAQFELKNETRRTANHQLLWEKANNEAKVALEKFFSAIRDSLKENARIQIILP